MMKVSALLAASLAVLDSAYAVQSNDNSVSTTSFLISHPSHAHHSSSSRSFPHSPRNSTAAFIKSSQTPHVVVPPTITKDLPRTQYTPATDKTSRITTKPTHSQHDTSGRIYEAATEPVHTPIHTPSGSSSTKPKTNTKVTSSSKPNTKSHSTTPTDTGAHNTNTPKKSSKADDRTTHKPHHTSHPEHTTDPSTTHDSEHLTTPFAAHSITAPAQASVKTGDFSTKTLSGHTGPPSSYSATTVTGHDHHPTILPVWFNKKGHAIVVSPVKADGPPGIIPPPEGLPKLSIGADGNPTPDPSNDNSPKTKKPKTTKETDDHTSKTHDKTASEKTSKKTTSTSSKTSSTSSPTSSTTTSTSTPTGKSTQYLIVPKKDSTQKQHKKFTNTLTGMVGKSKVKTKTFNMDGLGYWTAALNSTQVEEIKKESVIEGVVKDELITVKGIGEDSKKTKRTDRKQSFRNLVRSAKFWKRNDPGRQHAPLELALISQPKDNSISRDVWDHTYQYDESSGKGITVYVVDTGASPHNNEYKNMPGKKSWIYPGALGSNNHDTNPDDKFGHGTCVLSKIAGPKYGVAKNVDIVVVKLQGSHTTDDKGNPTFAIYQETYLDAIQSIIYDIKSNNRQGKAVVNMSFGLFIPNMFFEKFCERNTKTLTDLDVPIIVAAGNDAQNGAKEVNTYPGLWAQRNDGITVVGSTSDSNHISSFSQDGPLVTVYAPGDGILCAAPGVGDAEQHQHGTSFAAPAVAGLTAYLMALPSNPLPKVGSGQIPGFVHKQLQNHASWPRVNGGPNILWNGATWGNQDCDSDIDLIEKRNGGSRKCLASATTGGTKTNTATNTANTKTSHSTKSTKTSHTPTKGTTTSHHKTPAKTTHATITTSSKTPTKPTKPTPASLWCAPTHKPSATIPADKAQGKVESFCKGILHEGGAVNGFYPMSHEYKEYKKTYKLGDADTTFNLNWVKGRQAGITVNMCKDMLSKVIDGCSEGYGGGIPHKGIPTGVASFNVTLGKDN